MPHIEQLSPHIANLIAAGEVVERPASVVKELLENAVDAGARTVVLELRAGGRDYIRVTDDGVGMAPEDAGVCFLRHATSKLSDERGLEAIGTLGFRGEALAAISAVSPNLYEAATIDGCGRFRMMWSVTLPCIGPIITIQFLLAMGNIMNAGFDAVFNTYNQQIYDVADILDTYIYLSLIHI